mmetsp:Transcript_59559/g.194304  ORF Transcript_59559/g.194304 Transcript_59559/m.194304 type:complete len:296 (+) Transcript_59559:1662-2549(+)
MTERSRPAAYPPTWSGGATNRAQRCRFTGAPPSVGSTPASHCRPRTTLGPWSRRPCRCRHARQASRRQGSRRPSGAPSGPSAAVSCTMPGPRSARCTASGTRINVTAVMKQMEVSPAILALVSAILERPSTARLGHAQVPWVPRLWALPVDVRQLYGPLRERPPDVGARLRGLRGDRRDDAELVLRGPADEPNVVLRVGRQRRAAVRRLADHGAPDGRHGHGLPGHVALDLCEIRRVADVQRPHAAKPLASRSGPAPGGGGEPAFDGDGVGAGVPCAAVVRGRGRHPLRLNCGLD